MTPALRFVEAELRRYRHTWRSSVFSSFVNPVLFLLAMGLGLGTLVDAQGGPAGLPFVTWLAPGLIVATAMQTAAGESSYPVMAGIKWIRSYDAALATPLEVRHLVAGHLGWVTARLTQVTLAYAAVAALLGALSLGQALATVVPAVITGLAFAGPVTWYTARLERETGLSSLFRFGIVPLFLFSGTFFPVEQLPSAVRPLTFLTPLWHGVELARGWALGLEPGLPPAVHLSALAAVGLAGAAAAVRRMRRRLVR